VCPMLSTQNVFVDRKNGLDLSRQAQ